VNGLVVPRGRGGAGPVASGPCSKTGTNWEV